VTIPVNEIMKFVNEHSQLVLEIEGEATTEGTRAEQYTDTGGDHQRWRLKPGSSLYQVGLVIKCVWFRRGGLTRGWLFRWLRDCP
jgi:Ricin-type beta-trefoil lectin domain-like